MRKTTTLLAILVGLAFLTSSAHALMPMPVKHHGRRTVNLPTLLKMRSPVDKMSVPLNAGEYSINVRLPKRIGMKVVVPSMIDPDPVRTVASKKSSVPGMKLIKLEAYSTYLVKYNGKTERVHPIAPLMRQASPR